ncbi:hypothetical protein N7488_003750 [Penicillium malachiteum]|nr:hypothetical protein N7488_003750 [Penicillium malachiteum]
MPHHHPDLMMGHRFRRDVIPENRLQHIAATLTDRSFDIPSLVARAASSSATTSTSSSSEKSTSNLDTTVLPVVLGAGVPIICAIVILIVLHRRHVKKLLREDAEDKHKSLDFGMDPVGPRREGPDGHLQMSEPNHAKGLSLDVHPYLLPPGLHGSRDSLHSLSRSIDDDKYHPATFSPQDGASIRSFPRMRDDASSIAGSTSRFGTEEPSSGLLKNAQNMSRSSPPLYRSPVEEPTSYRPSPARQEYMPPAPSEQRPGLALGSPVEPTPPPPARLASPAATEPRFDMPESEFNFTSSPDLHFDTHTNDVKTAPEDRPNFPLPAAGLPHHEPLPEASSTLPRISFPASDVTSSDYGDDRRKSELMIPEVNIPIVEEPEHQEPNHIPEVPEEPRNLDPTYDARRDTRRLTLGVRPLPPEDPADNPEQRANRIRSFYKEYFDDSKRETTYGGEGVQDFYDGGYVYDPTTGDYLDATAPPPMPFAEPIGRRAMTPPPRAPPRFQGAARHMATNSAGGGFGGPGPRAFSSASGRPGPGGPGPKGPRRPVPPPAPLQILPTPHMLKDDSIMLASEFAPAHSFRERVAGRPETPTGGRAPYSPAMRAHTPLMSSFDDLAVIPSAHALRKSGTFTSLDFAPPPRFKNSDSGSDAGSIRSNRTGISNTHQNNIRMGNYRVSRLANDMVGTRDDIMTSLKPDWGMKR